MFLKKIHLTNFRNFSKLNLAFADITLLLGDNAQGKSNLLEAIYFLATTKSQRVEKDSQLIKIGESYTIVSAEVASREDLMTLEIGMQLQTDDESNGLIKKVKVNGVSRRVLDYIGNLVVVSFSPEDINLVSGPPALRRWHIDLTLSQIDREYKKALTEYFEVIMARNRLLKRIKEGLSRTDELTFWSDRSVATGGIVLEKRKVFFDFLNKVEKNLGEFKFSYRPSQIDKDRLREILGREVAAATTLIGPHRDDFDFRLNYQDLAIFGSRGEARTAVLDLKLSELEYIFQVTNSRPVLLLDDVFSELDSAHREHVISVVGKQQTIISAIETENIPQEFLGSVQLVKIKEGKVV